MTPAAERYTRIQELFDAVVELPPDERTVALEKQCGDDAALRQEVEALLAADAETTSFGEQPAFVIPENLFPEQNKEEFAGRRFGVYQVIREIGRGGLGAVYLAARADDEYRKEVAIKLIRRGLDTDDILRRFRTERQILAQLDHPNIARLIDGGTTDDGLPYFVMEYVKGEPINAYCEAHHLKLRERLELFRKVCAAVTYAHQNLVVHRDLKPSNILVTADSESVRERGGEPKLLDFGIAKLLSADDELLTQTAPGLRAMTPEYASPEQIKGDKITTSSDIYSLGVLLYELLTGQRPYRLKTTSADEIARAITEQEPERPSTVAGKIDHPPSSILDPRSLHGDLDNIILMALRKEPARRYASVEQFSEDIRRHLAGRPVTAHKDTFKYRSTKFIRRNALGVAAATIVFLTLVGGIVTTAWQARRAERHAKAAEEQARVASTERDRAQTEKTKAERINDFMQNILGFSDPTWISANPQRNREATITDALNEAAVRAPAELADQPEVLAAVHFTLGWTYKGHGKFAPAEQHLRASLDLRRKVLGANHPDCGQSLTALAELFVSATKYREAEAAGREAVAIYRRAHQAGNGDAKWFAISLNDHAIAHKGLGNFAEAETLIKEALDVGRDFKGAERAPLAVMLGNLGGMRRDQGDLDGAATCLRNALTEYRNLPRTPRFEMGGSLYILSTILSLKGEDREAESTAREAFDVLLGAVGDKHQWTPRPLITLAEIYYNRGDYQAARAEVDRALVLQKASTPEEHLYTTGSWIILGKILMRTHQLAEAESYLRRALEVRNRMLPAGHHMVAEAQGGLGECLLDQTRYDEAEPLLVASHTFLNQNLGARDPRTQEIRRLLRKLYEA